MGDRILYAAGGFRINITITTGNDGIKRALLLAPKQANKALMRTLNKTTAQANTAVSREIRMVYNISAARVKVALAVRKATESNLQTISTTKEGLYVGARGRIPGLQHYSLGGSRLMPSVIVNRTGGRKVVRNAFKADTPQGAIALWRRTGEAKRVMAKGRYAGKMREPIRRLYGPSVTAMMKKVGVKTFRIVVNQKFEGIFRHEFQYETGKGRKYN